MANENERDEQRRGGGSGERDEPEDLEELLDRLEEAHNEGGQVSVGAALDAIGRRSFGSILLAAGVFTVIPGPADIPGVPTLVAVLIFLVAGEMLLGQEHVWLPGWMLRRDVKRSRLEKGIRWARKPARWIDRLIRPRLPGFVHGPGAYAIAVGCIVVALALPPMEVVPFGANVAAAALLGYALGLIARDGLLALIAHVITLGAVVLVVRKLMGSG